MTGKSSPIQHAIQEVRNEEWSTDQYDGEMVVTANVERATNMLALLVVVVLGCARNAKVSGQGLCPFIELAKVFLDSWCADRCVFIHIINDIVYEK